MSWTPEMAARARELVDAAHARQVCTHDAEPDYCDGCAFEREISLVARGALLAAALAEIDRLVDENDSLRGDHDCTYKWQAAGMEMSERSLKAEIDRLTKALDTEWGRGWDEAMAEVEVTKVRKR